jgi:hypothetical protein
MTKYILAALALSLSVSGIARAEEAQQKEGETKMKIEDAADKKNKVSGDVDQEITNAKLRAEAGSKSRWSGSFTASYSGGSIEKPLDKDRPNLTKETTPPKVNMSGDFGVRYRLDKNQSLSLTTGYALERPLQEARRGQISNPSINYNNARKLGVLQTVFTGSASVTTNSDQTAYGDLGGLNASETIIYDFGGSRTSIGLAVEGYYEFFNKYDELVQPKGSPRAPAKMFQEDYVVAAYPFAEYAFNDKVNLRTVFRPWIFSHGVTSDTFTFRKRPWTQSLGIGVAVTRDVFLYPNFQWDWERWRRDDYNWFKAGRARESSTVGLSAIINIF